MVRLTTISPLPAREGLGEGETIYSRKCQTLGVPRQSRGFTHYNDGNSPEIRHLFLSMESTKSESCVLPCNFCYTYT